MSDGRAWTLLLPATRTESAWAALWAATLGQTEPPALVLVCDNGPTSVTAAWEWRFVADALAHRRIPVMVRRHLPEPGWNLGRAQHALLERARAADPERPAIFLDDDCLWECGTAAALLDAMDRLPDRLWFGALQLTPNPEQNPSGWHPPAELRDGSGFSDRPHGDYPARRSSGHALAVRRPADYSGALDGWPHDTGPDTALCHSLGPGAVVSARAAAGWEMAHPQHRRWTPNGPEPQEATP